MRTFAYLTICLIALPPAVVGICYSACAIGAALVDAWEESREAWRLR